MIRLCEPRQDSFPIVLPSLHLDRKTGYYDVRPNPCLCGQWHVARFAQRHRGFDNHCQEPFSKTCRQLHQRQPEQRFRVPMTGRHRDNHDGHISSDRCNRHGPGGIDWQSRHNLLTVDLYCGSTGQLACRWFCPRKCPTGFPPDHLLAAGSQICLFPGDDDQDKAGSKFR